MEELSRMVDAMKGIAFWECTFVDQAAARDVNMLYICTFKVLNKAYIKFKWKKFIIVSMILFCYEMNREKPLL